jgi:hypothetical protein
LRERKQLLKFAENKQQMKKYKIEFDDFGELLKLLQNVFDKKNKRTKSLFAELKEKGIDVELLGGGYPNLEGLSIDVGDCVDKDYDLSDHKEREHEFYERILEEFKQETTFKIKLDK